MSEPTPPSARPHLAAPALLGDRARNPFRPVLYGVVAVALVGAVLGVVGGAYTRTPGGEVAVIRNGGPLDNHRVRQVVPPASALTWTGLFSQDHRYPAQERIYTITSDASRGDRSGVDVENVPTQDGVEVGIEGTVYFTLNTDAATLRQFDNKYGTRKYIGLDGDYRYPYGDEEGWNSFLDQIVRPVISNDLRTQIGGLRCSQLQASCALVQNAGAQTAAEIASGQSNFNIAKVQAAINTSLAQDLRSTLGGDYITGVKFNLAKISLPPDLQGAINKAQAAFAQVTEAQARVASAKADADANAQRERGYRACPACATIDTLKAIPPNVTTFAPGSGFAITPGK